MVLIYMCGGYHVIGSWSPNNLGWLLLNHSTMLTWSRLRGPSLAIKFKTQDSGLLKVKLTKELESLYSSEVVGLIESVAFPHSIYC